MVPTPRFVPSDVVHHPQNGDEDYVVAQIDEHGGEFTMRVWNGMTGSPYKLTAWITQRGWTLWRRQVAHDEWEDGAPV